MPRIRVTNAESYEALQGGGYVTKVINASGNQLINAPKLSLTALMQYEIDAPVGSFTPTVNYSYKSTLFWDYQNVFREPPANMLGASMTFTPHAGAWDLKVWGKNLLGDRIDGAGQLRPEAAEVQPDAPLTFGVTAGVHF